MFMHKWEGLSECYGGAQFVGMGCCMSSEVDEQPVKIFPGCPAGEEWYHGRISSPEAELRMKKGGNEDGTYLVYDCPTSCFGKQQGDYFLLVRYENKLPKWRISRHTTDHGSQYVLGENVEGAETFSSVKKIIEHYRGIFGKSLPMEDGRTIKLQGYVYLA